MSSFQFIKDLSIKNKILVIVMFTGFLAMAAGFVAIARIEIDNVRKVTRENLILNAKLIGDYCVVPLVFGDKTQAGEALARINFLETVEEGYLYDEKGVLFARYPDSLDSVNPPVPGEGSSLSFSKGIFIVQEPILFKGEKLGLIYLKSNDSEIKSQIRRISLTFSLLAVVLLILSYILAWRMQKMVSAPIMHLAKLTGAISKNHDLSMQVEQHGNDEVGFLYEQFNNMLAQLLKREIERDKALDEIRDLNASLERKVAERTELLESANKELESFSYSVSHDLRAPLRHINGYLELLQKKNSEQLDEKGKHYISSIYEASNHMGHLIDDLLNFSRSGRAELKPDNIDMNKAVRDALMILDNDIKGRNIVWDINSLPFVHADYSMIRQVWVNLLGNAVKYTKFREVAYISVGWSEVNGEYVFFVKDNGAGFDSNYAQKLFGVFQRLHSNEEFEGTGIGLANVRQVIKRHGGRTWAEGEVDKGAVFYFTLPKK